MKLSMLAGAGLAVPSRFLSSVKPVFAYSDSDNLRKFIEPLRTIGKEIPIAQKDNPASNPGWWKPGVSHYTIEVGEYFDQLHPDLPNPTRLRGYGQNGNFKHLGGVIAAKRGEPVQITFRNNLPPDYLFPVDDTIMGVMGNQTNRTDVHLHGGFVPWFSDGGPHYWWDPDGHRGDSYINALNAPLAANEAEYYYPNQQSSRLMWYHDHVFGMTRTNAYAGIATGYVVYDDYELSLMAANHLPGPLDPRTVYMVFQDKIFVSNDIETKDPGWSSLMPNSRPGDLWYAHEYEPNRWDVEGGTPPAISCIPEFFGDTILVNGAVYPYLEVEPRQYRFRMLNACNARFLNPRLVYARGSGFPDNTEANPKKNGPAFIQIGTEGGFLPRPTLVNASNTRSLLMAPAERADLIVDFRDVPPGSTLILYSDASAPFPMGDDDNDDYPGNPATPESKPGFGPNTRTLLQIRVKPRVGRADPPISLPSPMTPTDPFLVKQNAGVPVDVPKGVPVRYLTLNEDFDENGRLIQMLGTNVLPGGASAPQFGLPYIAEPTEKVSQGSMEVWEIINLTGDTHPIHFHLVNVQILSRQPFNEDTYTGGAPTYTGKAYAPDQNELGWKETVRMNPGEVTRVLMKFNLPSLPFDIPPSPRTGGHEYVWHCHILEHEEHDMMRPLIVT